MVFVSVHLANHGLKDSVFNMKLFEIKFDDVIFTVYSSKKHLNTPDGFMLFDGPFVVVGSDCTCIICENLNSLHYYVTDEIIDNLIDPLLF